MAASSPILLERSIDIARPRQAVFEHVTDFERMHEWFFGVRRVSLLSPELETGAERHLILVHRVSHLERITEWNPPKSFSIRVLDPPSFTRRWEASIRFDSATDCSTRLLWEMRWEPRSGWFHGAFNAWLVRPIVDLALRRSLRRLKERMGVGAEKEAAPAVGALRRDASDRSAQIRRGLLGTIFFAACFCGYLLVQDLASPVVTLDSNWDVMIPFWPSMIAVYLAFFPYVVAAAFVSPARRFRVLLLASTAAVVTGWICFLALPASLDRPNLMSIDPQLRWVFGLVHNVDDAHNTFPSLHVAITWICSAAFWSSRVRWPAIAGAVAISSSTLLVKQHAIIDVVGGMALAAAALGLASAALSRLRP